MEGYRKKIANNYEHVYILEGERRTSFRKNRRGLFLDRDGVIIKDMHYLSNPEEVVLTDGIIKVLETYKRHDYKVVVVTNQSGIARNFYSWKDYEKVTEAMINKLKEVTEVKIDAIYANGYMENKKDQLHWRKPMPGMILKASEDLGIDLNYSHLFGDRESDV